MDLDRLEADVAALAARHELFERLQTRNGSPPLWRREPSFPTVVRLILEQQVSLASAQATYDKLLSRVNPLTSEGLLCLSDEELKAAGFSRQKTRYSRILADEILTGSLDLDGLNHLDDAEVRKVLTSLTGIGPGTAGIYLLMVMGRPDVWPKGDLALLLAMRDVKELASKPSNEDAALIAECWRPWRSVAARILWQIPI